MEIALRYHLLFFMFVLLGITAADAQKRDTTTKSTPDTTHHLKEVQIMDSRIRKEIIPVQTLSGQELKNLSAHSVADAIRYFSGAQVKDYGGIGGLKTVNIRSLGTQHVGVFYDGIELGNAQNGMVDLGRFSLDNMESISLYNGQKSAIFQPAKDFASAGSIYMVSRVPKFAGDTVDHYKITLKGGSFGTINPSVLWEHRLTDSIATSFSSEYLYTKGNYPFTYTKANGYDTTQRRTNDDVRYLRLEAGVHGRIDNGDWNTKIYFYDSDRGYPGASVRDVPGQFPHQDRQWDENLFIQSNFRKTFSPFYSLQVSGKYAYDYLHYLSDPRLDVSTIYVNNHYKQQETYLSAANLFNLNPWWSVNLSTDFIWNKLDADLVNFVYPTRYTGLSALATSLDFGKLKLQASLLATYVHETTRIANSAADDKQQYTPSLIFAYKPWANQDFNLRAFYKRIFRMPTLNDLYYTFIGNIDLKPEYTTQYDAGFTYGHNYEHQALRRIELQVDGYYNQVKNKIIAVPTSNQFRWTMINLGYVEIKGIDATVQSTWQISNSILLNSRLSYTYQKAQDFTDLTSPYYGGQIPYAPWNSGSVIISPSYKNWSLNYSYIYTGERYQSIANIPENYEKPFYTHDISLSRNFKKCRFTAEVNNLFNQQYEVVPYYPMPGINYKIIMNITI
ncbi:TonB-dependent receptor [Mucilaginibacter jinjuensis]|uniref:TonB-dependent receptor n=1 Tax=Mucilaginibacter jinjuensis TaxID=1176721 RepID=A0ABY7T286_9SPHI|nr:TonB-dependent receptor [Mucilaginibacter jinjuensis]WCT10436.1 TonB-dependent receptor [Mucilaginibacter jinjuensis]